MRKFLVFFFLIASVYPFESTQTLTAKVLVSDTKGYFILSDGSCWKVVKLIKRWRTPSEWWSGQELLIPDTYVAELTDCSFGDAFDVYSKADVLCFDESAASNEQEIRQCTHLLFNPCTEKAFFAAQLVPSAFVTQLYDHAYSKGYSQGRAQGYNEGYSVGQSAAAQY